MISFRLIWVIAAGFQYVALASSETARKARPMARDRAPAPHCRTSPGSPPAHTGETRSKTAGAASARVRTARRPRPKNVTCFMGEGESVRSHLKLGKDDNSGL